MFRTFRFVATVALVVCLPIVLALGWWQRDYLMGWYLSNQLVLAKPGEKNQIIEALSKLGEHAQYPLLDYLESADPKPSQDLCYAIGAMMDRWGGTKSKPTQEFYHHLARRFQKLPEETRVEVLKLVQRLNDPKETGFTVSRDLPEGTRWMLGIVAEDGKSPTLSVAIEIAEEILRSKPDRDFQSLCSNLVSKAIHSGDEATKVRAIRLAILPDTGMVDLTVQALQDPNASVRKAAMLACAPAVDAISVDILLPCLHDTEPEIRTLCESALGARGLSQEHIQLGRLITDSIPGKRLEVLDRMLEDPDLDQSIWLRKLSHDSSAAVRVAALRAMAMQSLVDMGDRIEQMARTDPSKTVVELATYYRKVAKSAIPGGGTTSTRGN